MTSSTVYVGGLRPATTEQDLERFFQGYGLIEVVLKKGYGFVELDTVKDAYDAVYRLNGEKLLGKCVNVERARSRSRGQNRFGSRCHINYGFRLEPSRTKFRLIEENLSSLTSWEDLKDHMRQAGEVTYADAHKRDRNKGVVDFASHSDMKNAVIKLDGTILKGRCIRLVESNGRRSRSLSHSSDSSCGSRFIIRLGSSSSSSSSSSSRSCSPMGPCPNMQEMDQDMQRLDIRSRKRTVERSRSRSHSRSHDKKRSKCSGPNAATEVMSHDT